MNTWLDYFIYYDFHGTEHLCYTGFVSGIDPYKFINIPEEIKRQNKRG